MRSLALTLLTAAAMCSCQPDKHSSVPTMHQTTSPIQHMEQEEATLVVAALIDYETVFYHRGRRLGKEAELIQLFAKHLKVPVRFVPMNSETEVQKAVSSGQADIGIGSIDPSLEVPHVITTPYMRHSAHLYVPKGWKEDNELDIISDNEAYHGFNFRKTYRKLPMDSIRSILNTSMDSSSFGFLLDPSHARWLAHDRTDLRPLKTDVMGYHAVVFPSKELELAKSFKEWWSAAENTTVVRYIMKKYDSYNTYLTQARSPHSSLMASVISEYDSAIHKVSGDINWDVALTSALIYQESAFRCNARSHCGASGLMQFMPATAAQYGLDLNSSPDRHIQVGLRKLEQDYDYWMGILHDSDQAINFALCEYNCGRAHVYDAMRLAVKHDLDPMVWEGNVEKMIFMLQYPEYKNDHVVKYGYCRGWETRAYVNDIRTREKEYERVLAQSEISQL